MFPQKLELKIQDWDKERTNFPFEKESYLFLSKIPFLL